MPEEGVEVVRRWFAALRDGDPAPEMCLADIEIGNWAESPVPGPYRGHDGVRRWWQDLDDSIDDVRFELESLEAIDESRTLTIQRLVGRFRHMDMEVDWRWGSIVTVRDGKIAGAVGYRTPAQAREAAGLE